MNWPVGGGWLAVVPGLACLALALLWWRDRLRSEALQRQIRLRAEAESDRLRLRISALKPVEARVIELTTDLAGLRPTAARVPELEEQANGLRSEIADANRSIIELERDVATLRPRAEEADELQLEVASTTSRIAELDRELATARERVQHLERSEADLVATRAEVARLTAQLESRVEREGEMSRELGALAEAVDQREAAATLAQARADAAEALIGRRDEIILILEQRLAERTGGSRGDRVIPPPTGNGRASDQPAAGEASDASHEGDEAAAGANGSGGSNGTARGVAAAVGSVGSAGRRKPSKAERKKAKKLAKQARKAAEAARAPGPAPLRAHRGSSDPRPVATAPAEAEHPGPTAEPDREPRSQPVAEPGTGGSTTDPRSPAPDAHRDDLQVISGIGPVMERALNDLGIRSWEQLAAMDERAASRLSARLPGVPGRVEREGWVAQAVDLVARHPLTEPYDRPGRAPLTPARD